MKMEIWKTLKSIPFTVIKYSQKYRDACLEEEMKKEEDKHRIFDWAKSVDDIII